MARIWDLRIHCKVGIRGCSDLANTGPNSHRKSGFTYRKSGFTYRKFSKSVLINLLQTSRPTPPSREIVFHSGNGNCTIVSQPCFTTRNLRTKLCGIRSQTEEQEFVDPFKSWYLETLSISEMENRLASPDPRLGEGLN